MPRLQCRMNSCLLRLKETMQLREFPAFVHAHSTLDVITWDSYRWLRVV